MIVIDADGHVEESRTMFSLIEKEFYPRRPLALGFDRDTALGDRNAVWLIDGKAYPKLTGKGGVIFLTPTLMEQAKQKSVSIPAQELTDVDARVKDLDTLGIQTQVVYPSLFLSTTTEDLNLESALFRAYNNFMADVHERSAGRIRFAAQVPVRDIPGSIAELRRCKQLGAASVMLHGMAWDKPLGHKDLFPLYQEAAALGVPMCVHLGWGCPALTEIFDASTNFYSAILPVLMGFFSIIRSDILDAVPNLKFGFLESGSLWIPYMLDQVKRGRKTKKDPAKYFREGRVFVSCESNEDINYLTSLVGEDCLMASSDYPHADPFHEENMVKAFMEREDIGPRVQEKLLSANAKNLYGF